jgi:hypothetical protein
VKRLLTVAGLLLAGSVDAQVRVCHGTDNCTEVWQGGHRQMSIDEARNVARSDARGDLARVLDNCSVARDPARCRALVRDLAEQFR